MSTSETSVHEPTVRFSASPEDLVAAGKQLRNRVSRMSLAEWKPSQSRRDPLEILRAADAERIPELVPIRYGRMLPSPFAYYRGSAAVMASDLANSATTGIIVQACGDCHLKNFGGFATPERNVVFDINDFDETLPGPWEWDIKRLAASFVLAVRENGLPEDVAHDVAVTSARSYRQAIREFAKLNPLDLWYVRMSSDDLIDLVTEKDIKERIGRRIGKATAKHGSDIAYPKLTEIVDGEVQIRDTPPLIFHPQETRSADFRPTVDEMLKDYRATLSDDRRLLFDRYRFVDAAIKVVGVGSVGTRCWIVLLMSQSNEPLFLQFKQAKASVLEPYVGKGAYEHNGQRVVAGQRLMQAASDIFLGWTSGPRGEYYVRQLRDAKISPTVEIFGPAMFDTFALACGWNLARAHAKTGIAWSMSGYLGKSDQFETAIGKFAKAYADQAECDHAELKAAVKAGKIEVYTE